MQKGFGSFHVAIRRRRGPEHIAVFVRVSSAKPASVQRTVVTRSVNCCVQPNALIEFGLSRHRVISPDNAHVVGQGSRLTRNRRIPRRSAVKQVEDWSQNPLFHDHPPVFRNPLPENSPYGGCKNRTSNGPIRENTSSRTGFRQQPEFSGGRNLAKWRKRRGFSLYKLSRTKQSRLPGGERGIRTPGTAFDRTTV